MKTILANQLNSEFINALNEIRQDPLFIELSGKKFVVLKAEEYQEWRETAYLLSSSKNSEILRKSLEESADECRDLKDVLSELGSETHTSG
jgi:PHD/YefM family antitoxin component YafN of YafNO toxin-antitoxin module